MTTRLLNGWKEIAQYLGRGVRTVQRWEAELHLPVRRPRGKDHSAVVALTDELDRWLLDAPARVFADEADEQQSLVEDKSVRDVHVLVVEDSVSDIHSCVSLLRRLRVRQVDVISSIAATILRLQAISDGKLPAPDVIILDLNFSEESGFEVLRYWKRHPALNKIRIIVWTAVEQIEAQLREVFGVDEVVSKSEGIEVLENLLRVR